MAQKSSGFSLSVALSAFILDSQSRNLSELTTKFYRDNVTPFVEWCKTQDIEFARQLTPEHFRAYLAQSQRRNLSAY